MEREDARQPVGAGRWAWGVAACYGATLFALTYPVLTWSFHGPDPEVKPDDVAELTRQWQYWVGIGALALLQAAYLFLLPVPILRRRPVTRRRWIFLAVFAAFLLALLAFALIITLLETGLLDPWPEDSWLPLTAAGVTWGLWAIVFAGYRRAADDADRFRRIVDRLLAGSVAELLVAVPCHVYVRQKDYCCAGFGTFVGLATGLAVMAFAFGPGVLFLFADRVRRLRGEPAGAADEPGAPTLGADGRDASAWAGLSLLCLLGSAVAATLTGGHDLVYPTFLQIAALVTGAATARSAYREWRKTRSFQRPLLVLAALLAGGIVLAAGVLPWLG